MKLSPIHIAIIVVIFLLVVINWKSIAKGIGIDTASLPKLPSFLGGGDTPSTGSSAPAAGLDCSTVLKKGSKGAEVQQLQAWILAVDPKALPKYGNDGDFGAETLAALQKITGYSSISLKQARDLINAKFKQLGSTFQLPSPC